MGKYLIGYISKTGTTKEIAEKIGAKFKKKDIEVDVLSLENIKDISQYSGVILGSPINGMKLLPEFKTFIETKDGLKNKMIGLFAVSYMSGNGRKIWSNFIQKDIDRAKSVVCPKSVAIFGGRIEKQMPGIIKFMFGLPRRIPLDTINWKDIDDWTNEVIDRIN